MTNQPAPLKYLDQLKTVGIEVSHEYEYRGAQGGERHRVDLEHTVSGVSLPFTAVEWCAMCMREEINGVESLYIGPCCGNTGLVQDIINGVFRDGGFINANDLATVGPLLRSHDGWEPFSGDFDIDMALEPARWQGDDYYAFAADQTAIPETLSPWDKICVIHAALEDALKLPHEEEPRRQVHPRVEERHPGTKVMSQVEHTLRTISWTDMFAEDITGDSFNRQNAVHKLRMIDAHGTHQLTRRLALMKLVQPARDLAAFVDELVANEEPMHGFALVKPGTDEVLESGRGLCIYADEPAALKTLRDWAKIETEESSRARHGEEVHVPTYINVDELAEMVPVTVTVADGLVVRR